MEILIYTFGLYDGDSGNVAVFEVLPYVPYSVKRLRDGGFHIMRTTEICANFLRRVYEPMTMFLGVAECDAANIEAQGYKVPSWSNNSFVSASDTAAKAREMARSYMEWDGDYGNVAVLEVLPSHPYSIESQHDGGFHILHTTEIPANFLRRVYEPEDTRSNPLRLILFEIFRGRVLLPPCQIENATSTEALEFLKPSGNMFSRRRTFSAKSAPGEL